MSKAQNKGKQKPSVNNNKKPTNETKPTSLIEIVPGKFNENDWNNMLEIEDSQEFVWEIIDEIFDNTLKNIHEKYLEKQTVPYTINEAKKAILLLLDWQFLSKDEDDDLTEVWVEDDEPEACVIDSWAQGYVQSVQKLETPHVNSINETPQADEAKTNFLEELNRIILNEPKITKKEKPLEPVVDKSKQFKTKQNKLDSIARRKIEPPPPQPVEPEIKKTVPREKNFVSEIKKLEEPISKAPVACQGVLKTLLSRPLALREIEIDAYGNVQSIAKLDLEKSTFNSVKPKFSIIAETKSTTNIDEMNKKKRASKSMNVLVEEEKSKAHYKEDENEYLLEPSQGVVFTMLNTTRAGPKRPNVSYKQNLIFEKTESYLRPVKHYDSDGLNRTSIDEILSSSTSIRAPVKFRPIPPINSSTAVN
ncbi:unnamed protein product [Brachionus calyciflorus]|uniref:Uncharacterized protein n=1 Tax=Brachionus calyciflorus TaxID=104777 RepID=A0A814B8I6_9BILA|nr:unnamed protein product [Brachionus calyciflorus]